MKLRTCLLGLLSIVILMSCDKIPSGVIDVKTADIKIVKIDLPESFTYSASDSLLKMSIQVNKPEFIKKVWLIVKTYDGKIKVYNNLPIVDDGNALLSGDTKVDDAVFSAKIPMSKKFVNGKYVVEIYAEDNINKPPDNQFKLGEQSFTYNNFQNNLPPIISNLVLQSSVKFGELFYFYIDVKDPNDLLDIESVYYEFFRPDGSKVANTQGITQFPLFDDGNTGVNGDKSAGDGTYTNKLTIPANQQSGNWRFEFRAKDRAANLSNIIIKSVTVN